jgi:predicted nucleotidyltransferase
MTWDTYIRGWQERARREAEEGKRREALARNVLPRLVRHLVDRYDVERVLLVGSLAEGAFGLDSDIDLAVRGLRGADLFRAGAELDDLAAPFSVDVIPLEDARPETARAFEERGERLYDR